MRSKMRSGRSLPRALAVVAAATAAAATSCGGDAPTSWPASRTAIVVDADAAEAVRWAADDLRATIAEATGDEPELVASPDETSRSYLLLVGDGDWECPSLDDESYLAMETRVGGRDALALCGGGLLGRQHVVYAYLHALGVRFVHPEQTFVPRLETLPAGRPEAMTEEAFSPGLWLRGFHSHTQHPLELLEALITDDPAEVERAHRFVDWLVRNGQNTVQWILLDSVPEDELLRQATRVVDYAHARGVLVSAVSSFNEGQQNAHQLLDPDDDVDDVEQLRDGLDALLETPWDSIVLNLGASEFSETDDETTVAWMDEVVRHLATAAPAVRAYASNHVPAGITSETYGVNFYDLPMFADPGMGTYVHTTMCYGLEGPAPVYGNTDFSRQRRFLLDQVDDRSIVYYPESAWWLTFDDAIPLFLPVYIRVRSDDIRFVGDVDGIEGHVTFTSGWEWGYWLTDLVIAHHTRSPAATMEEVLADVLAPIHEDAGDVVARMAESQHVALVEDRLMPFLTAEDLPTEIGYRAGIVFHPLAPAPGDVMALDEQALEDLGEELDKLEGFCEELDGFEAEWRALAGDGTTPHEVVMPQEQEGPARRPAAIGAAPLLEELRDGTAVTAARCRNALTSYRALATARGAALGLEPGGESVESLLAGAVEQTERAREIVARRETAYRYEPARTSDHEDTGGDGVENVTDYPYRVYGRTHVLFFWERRDELTAAAIAGEEQRLVVAPQQLLAGGTVTVDGSRAGLDEGSTIAVAWGDGAEGATTVGENAQLEHVFGEPSQPTMTLTAAAEGEPITVELPLSVATEIYELPWTELRLLEPEDEVTEAALRPFLPTLHVGLNGGSSESLLASIAFDRDGDGVADHATVSHIPPGARLDEEAMLRFEGFDMTVPVESASGRFGSLFLRDILLELQLASTDAEGDTVESGILEASVAVEDLIALLASTGVLERDDTVMILADIFGFSGEAPPETVTVRLGVSGRRIAAL